MTEPTRSTFKRVNLSNPEDMKNMLRSGAIWEHPQFWQEGFQALEFGLLPLSECKNVPESVVKFLTDRPKAAIDDRP